MRRFFVGLLILVSALTLVGSSTSLWTRRHIVNTDVFVADAQQILAEPAVRTRIETQVVDTIMARPDVQQAIDAAVAILPPRLQTFRPAIEDGAKNLLGKGVDAVMTAPAFITLTGAALRTAQTQLINDQSVEFTLGQAKALVPAQDKTGLAGQVLNLIPDNVGITVLTKAQAPQLYTAINLLKTLWLWVGLIALAALIGALVLSRRRRNTLRAWAVTTGVVSLLLVFAMFIARGPVLRQVKPANVDAADAIYQGVTASLRGWTLWLVLIMAGIVAITLLWGRIGIIPAIRRGYHAARAQAAHYREERAVRAATAQLSSDTTEVPPARSESWPHRVAAETQSFVDGLNLPERLGALAQFLRRNLRAVRWAGVAVGALVLLFWPSPTLSVLIWTAAFVALYLGLVELVIAIAARAREAPVTAAASASSAQVIEPEAPLSLPGPESGEAIADGVAEHSAPGLVGVPPGPVPDGTALASAEPKPEPAPVQAEPVPVASHAPVEATVAAPVAPPPPPPPPPPTQTPTPTPIEQAPSPGRPMVTPEDLSTMNGRLDLLMRLGDARSAGVLTEEEFAAEKAHLLTH